MGVVPRWKTVKVVFLPTRFYCDLLSCHSDVFMLIIHSISKPALVISEKMWSYVVSYHNLLKLCMGISEMVQEWTVQCNTEVKYGHILVVIMI